MTETTDSVNEQDGEAGAATRWAGLDGSARPAACTGALAAIAGWTPTPPPPTNPYSDAEDERILFLRDACRWTWPRIADQLGRPSGAIQRRRAQARKARRTQASRRQCIDCPGWIVSTGAGHRRCDECRARVGATPWDA